MYPLPTALATNLSGVETASLIAIAIGSIGLIAARLTGGADPIGHRAYGKLYGGAPGANVESKPEDR